MTRAFRGTLGIVLLLALVAPTWAQTATLKVSVAPERDANSKVTGNYVASVTLENAATAREVVFGLDLPTAYGLDVTASDIRVVAVKPGVDIMAVDANTPATPDPSDDTPVLFAENVTTTAGVNGLWIVGLLKNDATTATKQVCSIVFTSRGRATTSTLNFEAGVAVKDGTLAVMTSAGTFGTQQVPLFGDFNWDGKVNALDFALFGQAWRQYNATKTDKPFADLAPRSTPNTVTDPALMLSTGNSSVDALDFAAFGVAWRAYNKAHP
jgi:hypothetical protein